VSTTYVTPYPPGFPVLVPGQVMIAPAHCTGWRAQHATARFPAAFIPNAVGTSFHL
jgi:arginine/lysine/ornithine decarboxylase